MSSGSRSSGQKKKQGFVKRYFPGTEDHYMGSENVIHPTESSTNERYSIFKHDWLTSSLDYVTGCMLLMVGKLVAV